ncbi:MAG: phosphomethylpyrimidine synthase ThiC [Candidatus Aenigmarchaeota archaeon]|nr:phosphomethylpyrimidine synthase ThiC [Candidatus Aenigmarchaeota archaeon]
MQMEEAKKGRITEEMKVVAKDETLEPNKIRALIAKGHAIILKNVVRKNVHPIGIGSKLFTKINTNVGTSVDLCDIDLEIEKAKIAVKFGSDTVMDLSTAGDLDNIRKRIIDSINVPFGTVPVYQAAIEAVKKHGSIVDMTSDEIFKVIEKHLKDGVDFITVHCGVTKRIVDRLEKHPRKMGIVSRGGCFLAAWIKHNGEENPLYKDFETLLNLAKEYDVCLSLGDGLRPGCLEDASDWYQNQELLNVGKLVDIARKMNVQTIVEGPGHMPLNHIIKNVRLEKRVCKGAPYYVLGPLVTDMGCPYDHIVGAIGGTLAGLAGADYLCVVTPSEHLGIPMVEDVKEGVIASKLAAHSTDIVKLGKKMRKKDEDISSARAMLKWNEQFKNCIDPEKAEKIYKRIPTKSNACTMCGENCALLMMKEYLKGNKR